jgi:glycosyltransferase involved in cell wall biosynthesis
MLAKCTFRGWREGSFSVKVTFDSRATSDPNGIGRYSRCLLEALRETAVASDELAASNRPSATVRARSPDVFHSPWIDGAMLHSPCPMVVTIHSLASLKRRSEHLRTGLRLRLRHLAVQRAASVIVATEALAEDAVAHLGLERERVVVISEAADASMYPRAEDEVAAVREQLELPERYPGKHLAKLAAASRELPLVLVGPTRPWAHELPDVILTGQVSDEQLAAIYSGAHALLLPSEDESFGLPAVEALACGTPVVACEAPSLREVLGERATFVEPGDMRALITAAQSAERPAPDPLPWSWQDTARATWGVYAQAAASADRQRTSARSLRRRPTAAGGIDGLGTQPPPAQ